MIKEHLRELVKNKDEVYSVVGAVTGVDMNNHTCTVEPLNGTGTLYEVRLQSDVQDAGLLIVPKLESIVVVTFLNRFTGYVALCSEVNLFDIKIADKHIILDEKGFGVSNNSTSLKAELNNICEVFDSVLTTLQTFIVITPSGPSTAVSPTSLAKIVEHKVKLSTAKTKLNTLLQ